MGRKLRNREILNQTQQSMCTQEIDEQRRLMFKNTVREVIHQKLLSKHSYIISKRTKFYKRFKSGQIKEAIEESKLQCPICLEFMVSPSSMICGHIYCLKCLESNLAHSQRCCLCRNQQQNHPYVNSRLAETLISAFYVQNTEQRIKFLCRTTDSDEWIKRRKVQNLRVGSVVDFYDRFNKFWRRGVIASFSENQQKKLMVRMKMMIQGEQIFQTIPADSRRIAPFTFFSRKRYLQDFPPAMLPEYDSFQNNLHHLDYKNYKLDDQFFNFRDHLNPIEESQTSPNVHREQNFLEQVLMELNIEERDIFDILF